MSLSGRLSGPLTGALTGSLSGTAASAASVATPDDIHGSNGKFWGQGSATLSGSDVEEWTNLLSGGGATMDQTIGAFQASWLSSGGPDGAPCIEGVMGEWVDDETDVIAADTNHFGYAVVQCVSSVGSDILVEMGSFVLDHGKLVDNVTFDQIAITLSADTWHVIRWTRIDDTTMSVRVDDGSESEIALSAASYAVNPLRTPHWSNSQTSRIAFLFVGQGGKPSTADDEAMNAYLADQFPSLTLP